jgi:hypothetical protein
MPRSSSELFPKGCNVQIGKSNKKWIVDRAVGKETWSRQSIDVVKSFPYDVFHAAVISHGKVDDTITLMWHDKPWKNYTSTMPMEEFLAMSPTRKFRFTPHW